MSLAEWLSIIVALATLVFQVIATIVALVALFLEMIKDRS